MHISTSSTSEGHAPDHLGRAQHNAAGPTTSARRARHDSHVRMLKSHKRRTHLHTAKEATRPLVTPQRTRRMYHALVSERSPRARPALRRRTPGATGRAICVDEAQMLCLQPSLHNLRSVVYGRSRRTAASRDSRPGRRQRDWAGWRQRDRGGREATRLGRARWVGRIVRTGRAAWCDIWRMWPLCGRCVAEAR